MFRSKKILIATSLIATATAAACIPGETPEGQKNPQDVDAAQVRQAVTESSSQAIDSILEGLDMVQYSEIFNRFADEFFGSEVEYCETVIDPDFGEYESCTYEPGPYEPVDFSDDRDALIDFIENKLLADENIESDTGTAVIYLLGPDIFCEEDEEFPDSYDECAADIEALELRVKAQSFANASADLELMLGPDMLPVFTISFAPAKISASADLEELKAAYIAGVELVADDDADLDELPERMSGRVSASLEKRGAQFIASLNIDEAIDIKHEEFSIQLGAANAFSLTVDTAEEALHAVLGLKAIDIAAISALNDEDDSDAIELNAILPALQGTLAIFVNQEVAELRDLTLGNGTAILKADGEEIVSLDLNENHGRKLDADLKITDEETEITVGPAFDLELALAFYRVQSLVDEVASYFQEDLLKVTLDGDEKPAVSITESGLEVLRGQLSLSSQSAGTALEVQAGMCLEADYDDEMDEEDEIHPFETLVALTCGE